MARKRDLKRDEAFEIWKQPNGEIMNRAIAEQLNIDEKKVAVDPRYTSQKYHLCGHTAKENCRTQAAFICVSCGHFENVDINASRNIHDLATQFNFLQEARCKVVRTASRRSDGCSLMNEGPIGSCT